MVISVCRFVFTMLPSLVSNKVDLYIYNFYIIDTQAIFAFFFPVWCSIMFIEQPAPHM